MNNFYEKIEDYLLENLSEQEKISFEAQLAQDEKLKQDVDNQRIIIETLRQSKLRAKVATNLIKAKAESQNRSIAPMQWSKAAAIVGIISMVGIGYWLSRPSNQNTDVALQPTTPINIDTVSQKAIPAATPKVKDWLKEETEPKKKNTQLADIQPIKNKYQEPESGLRDIKDSEKSKGLLLTEQFFGATNENYQGVSTDSSNLQIGINFLTQKKYEDASRSLLKIEEESPVFGESQWFLALSFLARERYDAAKNILEDIAKQEKSKHQEKAKKILEKL
jgi:hypothetical protein